MDPEVLEIVILMLLGLTLIAFLLIRFTGKHSLQIMLVVSLLLSLLFGLITETLTDWGSPESNASLLLHIIMYWSVSCGLASCFYYIIGTKSY